MRGCLAPIAALLLLTGRAAGLPPIEVDVLWERTALLNLWPAEVTGDSIDEFIAMLNDATVEPRDQNLLSAGSTVPFAAGTLGNCYSVAGAADSTHAWITYKYGDTAFIYDLYGRRPLVAAIGRDASKTTEGWDGGISQVALADIDMDGRLDAIARVTAGWDAQPRGLFRLDWETGARADSFLCGSGPTDFTLADIDGDSISEIVFGTLASGNGSNAGGLSDSLTYVIVLGRDFRPKWIQPVGRHSSQTVVGVYPGGRYQNVRLVVCETGNSAGGRTSDSIFLLEPKDGSRLGATSTSRFNTGFTMVQDVRLGALAVVAGSDDTLRAFDSHLRVVSRTHVTGQGGGVTVCPGRFTGGRSEDVAVATCNGSVVIFDSRLRRLATIQARAATSLRAVRYGMRDRLLMYVRADSFPAWRLYEMRLTPFLGRAVTVGVVIPVFAALLLLFGASIVFLRYRQTRDVRAVVHGLTGQAGVVELNPRGDVRRTNPKARELLGGEALPTGPLAQAVKAALAEPSGTLPKELPVVLDNGKTVLARAARVRSGVMLTLEDISTVEYLKRVSTWVPVAQKLAHDIKNPLTAISLTLQRVEKAAGPDSQRYVDSMKDDIDRLKKMADGFMRLTKLEPPKLAPADINEVVRQCAGKFEGVKSAGVEFRYNLAEGLPPVALDRDQMAVACSNIIENSISAMGESGVLTIQTSLALSRKLLSVSFSDTGKGIPERYLAKVFEPYFTLKPGGTGLGMALTKRIIEDHKGTIRIDSREGVGTIVTIELPAA